MDGPQVKRPAPVWRNYAILVYTAIALAAVLIAANLLIYDHNTRFDLTPTKRYSLSQFDKKVLNGIHQNVKVMLFVQTADPEYLDLADLLFQVAAFTPRVTYQIIDVNKAPGLARRYGVSNYGEVVVESAGRRRDFDNARADLLIPALLQITHVQNKHIYFTVGHGERDLYSTDRELGYSTFQTLLQQNNYEVDNLSLFAGDVPNDANLVIILGPRKDFLPEELTALGKYLARGGHLIALIDPFGSPSLVKFLQQYHVDFIDRVVVDPAYRLTAGEILTTQIPLRSKSSDITRSMVSPAVFSLARPVRVDGAVGADAPGDLVLAQESTFLRSSHESWASGDPNAVTTGITSFKAGRDIKGPIPVGVEADLAPAGDPHIPVSHMTRIVALGNSAFCSNQFIEMLGNRDLILNAVNDLAGDQILIASRERLNQQAVSAFYVTNQQTNDALVIGAVVEPLILFFIGIAVFVRRRFFA